MRCLVNLTLDPITDIAVAADLGIGIVIVIGILNVMVVQYTECIEGVINLQESITRQQLMQFLIFKILYVCIHDFDFWENLCWSD
eukprot:scaffold4091_cov314-Chaetoceros_neogracile.AAC.1